MPNPRHQKIPGGGASNKASGSAPNQAMPQKTASWPGLPGKAQGKDRSGGTAKAGPLGPFHVKKEGL